MDLERFSWVWPIVLTALVGALGWYGRTVHNWLQERRQMQVERQASLQRLGSLLDTSERVFRIQAAQRNRLLALLEKNHPEKVDISEGYDAAFTGLYDEFNAEEKELHGVVRAMTVHAMRGLNLEMSEWLKGDVHFKTGALSLAVKDDLAEQLLNLELHLALWHAKYQYWIPENPRHALVYLGDEKEHGIPFPGEVKALVGAGIEELSNQR